MQYFDKGRMELTNSAVTNGLLATELVRGQIRSGTTFFRRWRPPRLPWPATREAPGRPTQPWAPPPPPCSSPATTRTGQTLDTTVADAGTIGHAALPLIAATTVAVSDAATQHNVPGAFAEYRNRAGLPTIGYAISEPFHTNVKVGGVARSVMAQVFERRVLTYTDANPDPLKVEMGNIGQDYFRWRYA